MNEAPRLNGDGANVNEPRALAEIRLNTLLAGDGAVSSDDDRGSKRNFEPDEARGLLGVSIGREQTRLKSPTTPAADKAAAIAAAGGFFGDEYDGSQERITEEPEELEDEERGQDFADTATKDEGVGSRPAEHPQSIQIPETGQTNNEPSLPSPWRAGPKQFEKLDHRKSLGLFFRRRASSGPERTSDGHQPSLVDNLPSVLRHFSLASTFGSASITDSKRRSDSPSRSRRGSAFFSGSPRVRPSDSTNSTRREVDLVDNSVVQAETQSAVSPLSSRPTLEPVRSRSSHLRRSTSDSSLAPQRTLSRVSSLGDDSRFDNVNAQVNSRLKAIKDSWQDSNIKLPSLPSLASITHEFLGSSQNPSSRKTSDLSSTNSRTRSLGGDVMLGNGRQPIDPMTRQPYHSASAAAHDIAPDSSTHPHFKRALSQLEGDVVVLGGYRGSILRSAAPPHRQLWVPIKVGLNIRKVDLEVGIGPDDDERASEKVIPSGMLTHIGPVDISRRLLRRLRESENAQCGKLRIHDYGYDWRLDPGYLSKQLQEFLEELPCNGPGVPKERRGATILAHSLGGLITRHAVNQRPELFKSVVYAGVPNTCVNILGPLRNGDDVLLSSRVLTAQVNFTIRTSFALLPLDGRCFFDKETKEEFPVDFFDVKTWLDYRLSPCIARPLPPLHAQPKHTGITAYAYSMASVLPIPGRSRTQSRTTPPAATNANSTADQTKVTTAGGAAEPDMSSSTARPSDRTMANNNIDHGTSAQSPPGPGPDQSPATAVSLPREDAIAYLERTLASVKKFKQELAHTPAHAASNAYPPIAVIYGKSTPTVYGAKVDGREGIKHADAYDELAFASGDGVVLARAAMVPEGYATASGGVVSSERGHVTLLGDLEAVGRCLNAVGRARRKGVGLGS